MSTVFIAFLGLQCIAIDTQSSSKGEIVEKLSLLWIVERCKRESVQVSCGGYCTYCMVVHRLTKLQKRLQQFKSGLKQQSKICVYHKINQLTLGGDI